MESHEYASKCLGCYPNGCCPLRVGCADGLCFVGTKGQMNVTKEGAVESGFWFKIRMPLGFASLTVILVGLIVLWKGYLEEIRWTWFIMLIIVSVSAFPVLVLPNLLHWKNMVPISEWFPNAIQHPGIERDFLKSITTCALLLMSAWDLAERLFQDVAALWANAPSTLRVGPLRE
jgi:hypothetical protein